MTVIDFLIAYQVSLVKVMTFIAAAAAVVQQLSTYLMLCSAPLISRYGFDVCLELSG